MPIVTKHRILVIGINCLPELTGIGRYTGDMVAWMAENGHQVTAVTTFPYYPYWKVQAPYSGNFYKKEILCKGNLTLYRCPFYVPAKPSGFKRLVHEASFFLSAFFVICRLLFKPKHDLIFSIAPPFHLGLLALFYRFFKGGEMVYHIQDLQIEAAKELKILKPDAIFSLLFLMERFILKHADFVSTISEGMLNKVQAKMKLGKQVLLFPNWVDNLNFYPIENRQLSKKKWGYHETDHLILYSGSIGEKQGLESLINIAAALVAKTDIRFAICGTGPYKENLENLAKARDLKNIRFFPLQSNETFNEFLNMADIHLVLQKGDAGDLVMPSKLTTILAIGGLPIVTAHPNTSLHQVVTQYDMGVISPPEDETALKNAIVLCCENNFDSKRKNARKYSEQFLDKEQILQNMLLTTTGS